MATVKNVDTMAHIILVIWVVVVLLIPGISWAQAQFFDPYFYGPLNEPARTHQADPTYGFPNAFFGFDPIPWSFMNPLTFMMLGGYSPATMPWGYPAGMMLGGFLPTWWEYSPAMMPWGYSAFDPYYSLRPNSLYWDPNIPTQMEKYWKGVGDFQKAILNAEQLARQLFPGSYPSMLGGYPSMLGGYPSMFTSDLQYLSNGYSRVAQ